MVNAIGFTSVPALMNSISYTSGATTTYFFPLVIYLPAIPFKRGPTKLPRVGARKGAKEAPLFYTKFFSPSFAMFLDSQVLESYRDFC